MNPADQPLSDQDVMAALTLIAAGSISYSDFYNKTADFRATFGSYQGWSQNVYMHLGRLNHQCHLVDRNEP